MFIDKILKISFMLLLVATTTTANTINYFAPTSADRLAYIDRYRHIAIAEMERTGIPASIKMAQGILESSDGKSELARRANNHFGIKCGGNWNGRTYYRKDDDKDRNGRLIKSCFRAYKNADESYFAHSEFLKKERYRFLFDYKKTEYKKWAKGLKKAGYATNPKYPTLLIDIIERHGLHHLDKMKGKDVYPPFNPSTNPTVDVDEPSDAQIDQNTKSDVFYHNDIKTVLAKSEETLREISQKYNISVEKLVKYNQMSQNIDLKEGTKIYLQPKRGSYRGKQRVHTVKKGQTMATISQVYGVKISKLYKRNRMTMGEQPAAGARIVLKGKAKRKPQLRTGKSKTVPKPTNKPKATPKPATEDREEESSNLSGASVVHTVKRGETLYRISKMYNVTVNEIKTLNKLKSDSLKVGAKLIIRK